MNHCLHDHTDESSSLTINGGSCELLSNATALGEVTESLSERLTVAGCPLASALKDRVGFESLLFNLSARFVNVPAEQVDAEILEGLRSIVEFLGIDRSGFGQILSDSSLAITHSYQVPGVPPTPKVILESQFPVYGQKIREGIPFRLPDDIEAIPEAEAERDYLSQSGLKSQLTIPLKMAGIVVGGIGFASFRSYLNWPDDLVRRLRLVGDIFTNALARKQADEALRALASRLLTAQEEERRLVAREMHDDWSQRLAVLGLEVARLEKFRDDPLIVSSLLRTIQDRLVTLANDVHDLSRQLHPSILNDLGLVEALRSECSLFTRREGIAVNFQCDSSPLVSAEVALCIYRVAQEALRNVAKHASVTHCGMTLKMVAKRLELTVVDEGMGFDPALLRSGLGIGVASMEERARLVRGTFQVVSAPGKGTRVLVRVPLEDAHE